MKRVLLYATITLSLLTALGCAVRVEQGHSELHEEESEENVELARYMGELQRFSQKLGYAVNAENAQLSGFYLAEVTEVLSELSEIEEHEGLPIARPVEIIMKPLIAELRNALKSTDWRQSRAAYGSMIDGCNRCHAATEHEFIRIVPALGKPVFNQQF